MSILGSRQPTFITTISEEVPSKIFSDITPTLGRCSFTYNTQLLNLHNHIHIQHSKDGATHHQYVETKAIGNMVDLPSNALAGISSSTLPAVQTVPITTYKSIEETDTDNMVISVNPVHKGPGFEVNNQLSKMSSRTDSITRTRPDKILTAPVELEFQ